MSKTRIFAVIVVAIMLAAVATNPSRQQHERVIRQKAVEVLQNQLAYAHKDAFDLGMTLFGDRVIEEFIQSNVVVKNYFLFSVTKIRWQGDEVTIGGGAFTHVWLSERLDEEADKIIRILKDL